MPVTPFNAVNQTTHGAIFGSDEFSVLYEELGAKMEAFLNSCVNVPALQVNKNFVDPIFPINCLFCELFFRYK